MKKHPKEYLQGYMIRPIAEKTLVKAAVSAILCALWNRFFNPSGCCPARAYVAAILAVVFLAQAWFSFLRLDGLRFPHLFQRKNTKRPPTGSMMDYLDTEPSPLEELQDDEREVCTLVSSLLCSIGLFLAALL